MTTDDEAIQEIHHLKTRAKNRRDSGSFDRALAFLGKAAQVAEERVGQGPHVDVAFASELADIYGIMGGIARRQGLAAEGADRTGKLAQSVEYYDEGFKREKLPGVVNTYNRVNRLVGQLLLDPSRLDAPPADAPSEPPMIDQLREAIEVVEAQVDESRNRDPWALADRALLEILISPMTTASSAYGPLHRTAPPSYVYQSALATLRPLAAVVADRRPELGRAVVELDAKLANR